MGDRAPSYVIRTYRTAAITFVIAVGVAIPPLVTHGHVSQNVMGPIAMIGGFLVTVAWAYDHGVLGGILAPPQTYGYYFIFAKLFGYYFIPIPEELGLVAIQIISCVYIGRLRTLGRHLRRGERRFRALTADVSDLVIVIDEAQHATYVSDSFGPLLGYEPQTLLGTGYYCLFDKRDEGTRRAAFAEVVAARGASQRIEVTLLSARGVPYVFDVRVTNYLQDPAVRGVVCSGRDITERKKTEALLMTQAFHDALTGLPNRSYFLGFMEREIERAAEEYSVAVLFIDLDGFKQINDGFGHQAGDDLLREIAHRISECALTIGIAARIGGDEFAVLLPGYGANDAKFVAKRIIAAIEEPVEFEGRPFRVGASIGIAATTEPVDSAVLLQRADGSMYAAKRKHSGIAIDEDGQSVAG